MEKHSVDVATMAEFVRCEKLLKMGGIVAAEGKKSLIVPVDTLCNIIMNQGKRNNAVKMAIMRLVTAAIEYYKDLTISLYDFVDYIATIEFENATYQEECFSDDKYDREAFSYMQGIRRKIVNVGFQLQSRDVDKICDYFGWEKEIGSILVELAFTLFDYELKEAKESE